MIVSAGTADFLLRQELGAEEAPEGGAGEERAEGALEDPGETQEEPQESEDPSDGVIETPEESGETTHEDGGSAYAPNYTFKVHDKEHEFDEWAKALVQDAETEGRMRDLYERAHGLDAVKQSRDRYAQSFQQLETRHNQLVADVQTAAGHVRKGDLQSFFETLQIPEDQVLRYALERIQLRNATPEQRQAYEEHRASQQRMSLLEAQNAEYQQVAAQQAQSHRNQELEIISARPEVAAAIQGFDARVGRPGAFMEQVRRIGQHYWNQGTDIGAEGAVKEVMTLIGATGQPPVATGGNAPGVGGAAGKPGTPQNGAQRAPAKRPVIPNIAGSGASPTRKVPKSIAQLRQMAADAAGD